MLIQIAPAHDGDLPEWAIIELQGEVHRADEATLGVGHLSQGDNGKPTLTIGYHQLEGERQALKKPLAVMERAPAAAAPVEEGGAGAGEGGGAGEAEGEDFQYRVLGVVRQKLVFRARPRPLISKPEGGGG